DAFPASLYREQRTGQSALVLELVGDDALEAHDEGQAAGPRPEKTVQVHAVDEVNAPRRAERDAGVVDPAVEGVEAGAETGRPGGQAGARPLDAALWRRDT